MVFGGVTLAEEGTAAGAISSSSGATAATCPYPYTFFDPARPKITERKRMIVPNAYGFGYPGYWCGGWTVVGYGGWYIPGSLCGYNVWSGYGVWPSRFTINIRL